MTDGEVGSHVSFSRLRAQNSGCLCAQTSNANTVHVRRPGNPKKWRARVLCEAKVRAWCLRVEHMASSPVPRHMCLSAHPIDPSRRSRRRPVNLFHIQFASSPKVESGQMQSRLERRCAT